MLRWVQGQKSWKHDFEITGDPKGSPSESTVGPFYAPKKPKMANKAQNQNLLTLIDRK